MDELWKESGLDLRLTLYRVMSTDSGEGFIEIVQDADTLCRIQMKQQLEQPQAAVDNSSGGGSSSGDLLRSAGAVLRKGSLLSWLRSHNSGDGAMRNAQEEFTRSCAGYVVATYILVSPLMSLCSSNN